MEINKKAIVGTYIVTYVCLIVLNFIAIEHQEIKGCFSQLLTDILGYKSDGFQTFRIYLFGNPWIVGLFFYVFKIKWIVYCFIVVNILLIVALLHCYIDLG
ncbi:hypothetical protein [Sphingobacterium ginsenosidimutans]|uniref:Uncharacterized protein n=1 Tax=Sphingobacterium ginsenosidimutans TaxID=687845 RepID=A0ABP7ZQR8_9SPHI